MIMTQNHNSDHQEPRVFRDRGASLLEDEPLLSEDLIDISGFNGGFMHNGASSPFDDDTLSSFSGSQFDSESDAPSTLLSSFDDVDFAAHNAFDALDVPDDAASTVSMEANEDMDMNGAAAVSSSLTAVSAVSVVDASIGSLVSDESMRISENRMSLLDRIGASSYNTERTSSSATHTRTFRSTPSKNSAAAAAAAATQLSSRSGKFVGHYDPAQRAERIKRFHEKRLRRRWGKRIKYMDRKLQAENQKRVRGRFAKVDPALKAAAAAKLESPLH